MVHTHTRIYGASYYYDEEYYGLLLNERNKKQTYLEFKWAPKLVKCILICRVLFYKIYGARITQFGIKRGEI
jgi:hypothetical protein